MTTEDRPYHVEVSGSARRDLRRLSGKIAAAMIEFIAADSPRQPQRLSKALCYELAAYRRRAAATARVLFRIDDDKHTIVIVAINHRARITARAEAPAADIAAWEGNSLRYLAASFRAFSPNRHSDVFRTTGGEGAERQSPAPSGRRDGVRGFTRNGRLGRRHHGPCAVRASPVRRVGDSWEC